ncbi:universal stress protein [Azospirillum thermophilum]|nr:universal stress protein [Azospirillum thermophilum]
MDMDREPWPPGRRRENTQSGDNVVPLRPESGTDALAPRPTARRAPEGVPGTAGQPSWSEGPPHRILLATDLSFRCERALERAASLSAQWQSELVVLHVLDTPTSSLPEANCRPSWPPVEPRSLAWKRLLADVGAVTKQATLLIQEGDPAEAIVHTVETEHCGLIVLGITRDAVLERIFLDRTTDRLLRRSRVPLLIVKERSWRPYRDIVVATDFSDASCEALEVAARLFPGQAPTVFHAYEAPFSGLAADPRACRRDYRDIAMQQCRAFLARVRRPAAWRPERVVVENGSPDLLLRNYVRDLDVDLVVLGMHRRNAILELIAGSIAKTIMDDVPCDVLVIQERSDVHART